MVIGKEGATIKIILGFKKPRYAGWIEFDPQYGYMVGINKQHLHFDEQEEAWDYFHKILTDQIAVVGLVDVDEGFILAILELDVALSSYKLEQPKVEIETFSKSH